MDPKDAPAASSTSTKPADEQRSLPIIGPVVNLLRSLFAPIANATGIPWWVFPVVMVTLVFLFV